MLGYALKKLNTFTNVLALFRMPYFYLLFHSFIIYITLTARGLFLLGVRQILCRRKVCILILCLRLCSKEVANELQNLGKDLALLSPGFLT